MPLRDRKSSVKPKTSETLAQLEQQVQAIGKQLSERFDLLQVPQQQEVDKKTARQAVEYEREYEMVVLPFRHWDPSAIINAKSMADEGDLELCADLWESALADDRVASAMEQRINGLEGLPVRFTGDGEDVLEAISTDFWQMMKPGDRALTRRWAYGVGICPVYATEIVENGDGRQILILEPWSPRFLRWRQGAALGKREWWIQTARGQIRLADQPGRWFLFTPFSGSNQRPWVDGLWYSTATWFLAKSFGIADLASFSQSHATPKWFLMPKEGAQISGPEKAEAIRRLAALPQRSGMYIPSGFTVEQKETTSAAWNAITALIELANKALTVRIIGTDSTTDKESSFASTAGGMQLLYVKFRTDADAESAFWHDGPLQFWYLLNFRGARKLQDRRVLDLEADPITGVYRLLDESDRRQVRKSEYGQRLRQLSEQIRGGDEVPWPTRDATPPEDMAAVAETQGKAAAALVQLAAASTTSALMGAAIAQIDLPRFLERYFPMQAQDESGVQLEMKDGTILELGKGKTGSGWITVNGTRVYAEPGKAIDFKNLKATAGGQHKGSDGSDQIDLFALSAHTVEHTNSKGDKLTATAKTSFIPDDKIGFIKTDMEYTVNGESMIAVGEFQSQGGIVGLQKPGAKASDPKYGLPLAKKNEAVKAAEALAQNKLPKEWEAARAAISEFENDYTPEPSMHSPKYKGTESEYLFSNPKYQAEKKAWATREGKRQKAKDAINTLHNSKTPVADALKKTRDTSAASALDLQAMGTESVQRETRGGRSTIQMADQPRDERGRFASDDAGVFGEFTGEDVPSSVIEAFNERSKIPPNVLKNTENAHDLGTKVAQYSKANALPVDGVGLANALVYGDIDGVDFTDIEEMGPVSRAFYEAASHGYDKPVLSFGWRYGDVPESGVSTNFREGRSEAGVSMMKVAHSEYRPDDTFAMFNAKGRPKVWVTGWVLDRKRGSDGEALMVGVKKVDVSKESKKELEDQRTNFPTQGDSKAVSLRNSAYPTFDPDYIDDIRENWPDIWNAGGNDVEGTEHSGDDQYRRLRPVVARGGAPETDTEEQAIRRREAWAARHNGNNRLAGVVALMKWFVVGEVGEKGMKAVLEERKDAIRKQRENQDRGPTLLLQSSRNIRAPLHEGLEFVDETVDAMSSATPVAMDDITGQILRVLADAKDYTDARKRLQDAFPTMDRERLRNMLTGGMLIAQAAGRESVQREAK